MADNSDDDDDIPQLVSAKVPVTILTGFLGSGKTTLLQYVLQAEHKLRIAVVVNEFEFGRSIEKGLTVQSTTKDDSDWIEMKNGCMCCAAKGQTAVALEKLIQRSGSFDLVLIETAGLANPAPICATFWMDDALRSVLFLAGVVTVVDAKNIAQYLNCDHYIEASQQLLVCDRIVLNKIDLVDEKAKAEAITAVRQINSVAPIIMTTFSRVEDLQKLLILNTTNDLECFQRSSAAAEEAPHVHSDLHSLSIEIGGVEQQQQQQQPQTAGLLSIPSLTAVDNLCAALLYSDGDGELPFEVVRMKAAVWVGKEVKQLKLFQIQSIGDTFDVTQMAGESVPRYTSRFLLLGRNLPHGAEGARKVIHAAFCLIATPC